MARGTRSWQRAASGQRKLVTKRILIVEDEPLIAMDIEGTLGTHGYAVVGPVGTLAGALEHVEQGGFDAALIDANLDGEPVGELAAALTAKDIPFAFVTGYTRARHFAGDVLRHPGARKAVLQRAARRADGAAGHIGS